MDSSPQGTHSTSDAYNEALLAQQEAYGDEEEEQEEHIHLPNPSLWPLLLSIGIIIVIFGLLFVSSFPWVAVGALVLVLIGILGWALEDPMAPLPEEYITVRQPYDPWKYKIGQGVVDAQGQWLGEVRARFANYVLVERGGLRLKVYYVPVSAIKDEVRNNTLFLTLSEETLVDRGLTQVPDDLYEDRPEVGPPVVRGVAQFARRPLSPAETGHYHYGRHSPGINTDASGSYHRREVLPTPQTYVTEGVYSTDEPIPARVINPD